MLKKSMVLSLLSLFTVSYGAQIPQSPILRMLTPDLHYLGAGSLEIIGGPMASGKSLTLMRAISVLKIAGIKTLVCKHSFDTRSTKFLTSRMNVEGIEALLIDDPKQLLELDKLYDYQAIAIDEVQFFTAKTLIPVIKTLLESKKYIVAAGLLTDIRGDDFGCHEKEPLCMRALRSMAVNVLELKAVCMHCRQLPPSASMTQRLVNNLPAHRSDPLVMIDDGTHKDIIYEARCGNCFELPE